MAGISILTRYPSKLHSEQREANRSAKKGSNLWAYLSGFDWIRGLSMTGSVGSCQKLVKNWLALAF